MGSGIPPELGKAGACEDCLAEAHLPKVRMIKRLRMN